MSEENKILKLLVQIETGDWGRIDCPERRSCWHAIAGWLVIGVVVFIVVAEVIAFAHL